MSGNSRGNHKLKSVDVSITNFDKFVSLYSCTITYILSYRLAGKFHICNPEIDILCPVQYHNTSDSPSNHDCGIKSELFTIDQ